MHARTAAIIGSVLAAATLGRCSLDAPRPATRQAAPAPYRAPFAFVENAGQWDGGAAFVAWTRNLRIGVRADRADIDLAGGAALTLRLDGASPGARITGEDRLPSRRSFFLGRDPRRWRSNVRAYRSLRVEHALPGVDLRWREHDGHVEYDVLLAPGADLDAVRFTAAGARSLRVDAGGALVIETAAGPLRQPRPRTWQVQSDGTSRPVRCDYVVHGPVSYGFAAREHDAALPLVVDPGLIWMGYLGGTDLDEARATSVDRDGNVVIAGNVLSVDFPTTAGAYDRTFNGEHNRPARIGDVFVAKFARDTGQLLWATYVGGKEGDYLEGCEVVPASGDVVLGGWTTSVDFPTTPGAFDRTYNGTGDGYRFWGGDLFVARVKSDGSGLAWSTFVGGNDLEYVYAIDVTAAGAVALTGHVHSTNFPTTPGALSATRNGFSDCYITIVAPDGASLLASTYLGGSIGEEYGRGIEIAADGTVYVAGPTDSRDLPVTAGAYDTTFNGGSDHWTDGFVCRLDAKLGRLLFCTYLGSGGNEIIHALAVAGDGSVTVGGEADSQAFPTTAGAFDTTHNGGRDGFVARLDASGKRLLWSTFLGGAFDDSVDTLRADGGGGVFAAGVARSPRFPVTAGAADTSYNGGGDVFLSRLDASGRRLAYSTFLGGSGWDWTQGVSVDAAGDVAAGGITWSVDLPTTARVFQPKIAGRSDAFAARLDALPSGAARFGRGSAGCRGLPVIDVGEQPRAGALGFAVEGRRLAPSGAGLLVIGAARLTVPLPVLGIDLWVDPTRPLLLLPAASDANGGSSAGLPLPAGARGARVHAQWVWLDACAPSGLSASNALTIDVQ